MIPIDPCVAYECWSADAGLAWAALEHIWRYSAFGACLLLFLFVYLHLDLNEFNPVLRRIVGYFLVFMPLCLFILIIVWSGVALGWF